MILSSEGGCTIGAAAPAAGAFNAPPEFAVSISWATMRPYGPEPCKRDKSILASLARRLASGDAKMRLPSCADAGIGVGAVGCGGAGAGAGAAACLGVSAGFASAFGGGGLAPPADAAAFTSSP